MNRSLGFDQNKLAGTTLFRLRKPRVINPDGIICLQTLPHNLGFDISKIKLKKVFGSNRPTGMALISCFRALHGWSSYLLLTLGDTYIGGPEATISRGRGIIYSRRKGMQSRYSIASFIASMK